MIGICKSASNSLRGFKQKKKNSAKKLWYPMCLIFSKKLVTVTRRLIYFPTVTALKPNCPWVSWLSPTRLSHCPFEKNELTSHAQTSKSLFSGNRQNYYQAVSGAFIKLVGISHWVGPLLLLYHKISDYSGFPSHLCITTLWLLPVFCTYCLHT